MSAPIAFEFLVTGSSPSSETAQWFSYFFEIVRAIMKVPPEFVTRVIVADTSRFGEAVGRFDPSRAYTNSNNLRAVGKTVAHREANGRGPSSIIILDSVMASAMIAAKEKGPDFTKWDPEEQRSLYVLFHELGHVADHAMRSDFEFDGTIRTAEGQRAVDGNLRNMCGYHFDMLLSELAACVFGGIAYTSDVRRLDIDMNNDTVSTLTKAILALESHPTPDLNKIRFDAVAFGWFILFQHAKLVGSSLGNSLLPPMEPRSLWTCAQVSPAISAALVQAEKAMRDAWEVYPKWTVSHLDEMIPCFETIAAALGFEFQDLLGRNGVWWQDHIQTRFLSAQQTTTGESSR